MTKPTEPPHDDRAERALLGAILLDDLAMQLSGVVDLPAEDFYRESHQVIWRAYSRILASGESVDQVTLCADLKDQLDRITGDHCIRSGGETPESLRGTDYFTFLLAEVPAAVNATSYAGIVRKHAKSRAEIDAYKNAAQAAQAGGEDVAEQLLAKLEKIRGEDFTGTRWDSLMRPAGDWVDTKPPPPECLLEIMKEDRLRDPYLRMGTAGMLVAPGGTGKSFALLQLGVSVVTGKDWLGLRPATTGPVCLILGEDPSNIIHERLFDICNAYNLNPDELQDVKRDLHILPLADVTAASAEHMSTGFLEAATDRRGQSSGVTTTPFYRWLQRRLGRSEWRLIVVDPMSQFLGAGMDSNRDTDATRFVVAVRAMTRLPGKPPVLVSHHMNKGQADNASAQRGSSAFTDGFRWQANMKTPDKDKRDELELKVVKSNTGVYHKIKLRRGAGGVLRASDTFGGGKGEGVMF